jgi:lysophospholipase L1-like esterase
MNRQISIGVSLLLIVFLFLGADFKKTLPPIQLENGDTFVFIGNSITHQCLYTQYVEDYFYTRYPAAKIRFHNAGVSGDVAEDVLNRFDDDIAGFKPKYASILIGMNDGRYTPFENKIFETYKTDMTIMLNKLEELKIIPIVMTPTMYDLRPALKGDNWLDAEVINTIHYNATLSFFGAWLLQMANERGLGYVNMYEPLNRITRENRLDDPEFTMIRDAVHPEPSGQVVMALALLRDIGANPVVSSIHLDVQDEELEVIKNENGKLENLQKDPIQFEFTSKSLPWVVPDDASLGFKLTNAGELMSQETVKITGLAAGDYSLQIDGETIGDYTYLQFSEGIELQENDKTPQYKQSAKVAQLNKERNEEVVSPIRDLWLARKIIRAFNETPDDFESKEDKEETRKWMIEEFGSLDMDSFLETFQTKLDSLKQRSTEMEDQIYEINKSVTHLYEIVKKRAR